MKRNQHTPPAPEPQDHTDGTSGQESDLPYVKAATRSGWLKRGTSVGLLALSLGGVGLGLAACSGAASADTGSSGSSQSSQAGGADSQAGETPDGQGGPFADLDTAAVAEALGIDEDTLTEAISSIRSQQGQAPGDTGTSTEGGDANTSGSTQSGGSSSGADEASGSTADSEDAQSNAEDTTGETSQDPMVAALASALDLDYDDVLTALEDNGFTAGGPGGQGGPGEQGGQGQQGGQDAQSGQSEEQGTTE